MSIFQILIRQNDQTPPSHLMMVWTGSYKDANGAIYCGWLWKAYIFSLKVEAKGFLNGQTMVQYDGVTPFGTFINFHQDLKADTKGSSNGLQIIFPAGVFQCFVASAEKTVGNYPLSRQQVTAIPKDYPFLNDPGGLQNYQNGVETDRQNVTAPNTPIIEIISN